MCGDCCKGLSKEIVVTVFPSDSKRISSFLNISIDDFMRLYTYSVSVKCDGNTYKLTYLIDVNGVCVFLNKNNSCSIHEVKPVQCLRWPVENYLNREKEVRKYPCIAYNNEQKIKNAIDDCFIDEILLEEEIDDCFIDEILLEEEIDDYNPSC
jgi:Fe-S-cluster containining protein